jgi:biotin carboxylase
MSETILMLGGSFFQLPPIRYAKAKGYHVIVCDANPDAPGRALAHEFHSVSTTDSDTVLTLAKARAIDGIIAFASDPAAPTAAFVAERLGLAGNPAESVRILTNKDRYRSFLREHGFHAPPAFCVASVPEAVAAVSRIGTPCVVKPVDSSGSRGVTVLGRPEDAAAAFAKAIGFSRRKEALVEGFVKRKGYQIAGDGFVVDGKLAFRCFGQEHFDPSANPLVPVGESFPLLMPPDRQDLIHCEIQRLLDLTGMRTGALNFDVFLGDRDEVYLMEVGPRNGGNRIAEITLLHTGIDMIRATVEAALGHEPGDLGSGRPEGCFATYIIHSTTDGKYKGLRIDDRILGNLIEYTEHLAPGGAVKRFDGSNCTLGTMLLRFADAGEMLDRMRRMGEFVKVEVEY